MKRILIGIPTVRRFEPFWESLKKFLINAREFYEIDIEVVVNESLGIAQNKVVDKFLDFKSYYDYLLFLDDDHWGHTVQMLDCLVNANTQVATIKTFSRHFPYACPLIKYIGKQLVPIEDGEGYIKVDLTGFPMTLIRRDTFIFLDKPYFREEEFGGRTWNTDENFFVRLNERGIKPIGCYQHCLNHDIVTPDNVMQLRIDGCKEERNKAMFMALNIQRGIFERSL